MFKAIYFDMDGTIADLYSVQDWEEKLNAHDESPYIEAKPMCNMEQLQLILERFTAFGITIGVISWLAMNSNRYYDARVRNAKRQWLKEYLPQATEVHFIKYGTTKRNAARHKNSILVDDNEKVRNGWRGYTTIDATKNIIKELQKYLAILERTM